MHAEDIIKRPILLTEKAARLREDDNQVIFEVARAANKIQIKEAVETLFDVKVLRVNVMNAPAKRSRRRNRRLLVRRPSYKKAIVTLAPGDAIDVFEGVR